MEVFICKENIRRFRKLLNEASDPVRAQEIQTLLSQEEASLERLKLVSAVGGTKLRFDG